VTSVAVAAPVSSSGVEAARNASAAVVARPGDRDGDGFRDEDDFCPDAAEDLDDCNDEDGCPDPDDDGDGVLDAVDKCPTEHDRHSGRDGCPAPLPPNTVIVESTDECFIMMEPIDFARNEATIGVLGGDILDHIAEHFRRCNLIVTLEIRGKKGVNEKAPELAAERAEAVRAALVARGVEARRLRVVTDTVVAEPVRSTSGGSAPWSSRCRAV
jgi:outer membrane protein OmpA-like peptidoglycan-associated protein